MVKNNKIFKRISALCVGALVLFVAVAPALSPAVSATMILPNTDNKGNLIQPTVARWAIPLDIMRHDTFGVEIANPFYDLAVAGGTNHPEYIKTPPLSIENMVTPLEEWSFTVTGWSTILDQIGDKRYSANYSMLIDSKVDSCSFSFYNSQSFIAYVSDIYEWLLGWKMTIAPGRVVKAVISGELRFPHFVGDELDDGIDLFELDYYRFSQEFNVVNYSADDRTDWSIFSTYDIYQFPWEVIDYDAEALCIFNNFSISFEISNPQDGVGDDGSIANSMNLYSITVPVYEYLNGKDKICYEFSTFYRAYPSYKISSLNDASGSFVSAFLGNVLGGFLSTQIVPGISFGAILATIVGIGLVFVFLKIFGG